MREIINQLNKKLEKLAESGKYSDYQDILEVQNKALFLLGDLDNRIGFEDELIGIMLKCEDILDSIL